MGLVLDFSFCSTDRLFCSLVQLSIHILRSPYFNFMAVDVYYRKSLIIDIFVLCAKFQAGKRNTEKYYKHPVIHF